MHRSTLKVLATTSLLALLSACGPPPIEPSSRTERVRPGDNALSCGALQTELAGVAEARRNAEAARQSSAANLDRGRLIPVVGGGLANRSQVEVAQANQDLADLNARRDHLVGIANGKRCRV